MKDWKWASDKGCPERIYNADKSPDSQSGCDFAYDSVEISFHKLFLLRVAGQRDGNNSEHWRTHIEVHLVEVTIGTKYNVHIIQASDLCIVSIQNAHQSTLAYVLMPPEVVQEPEYACQLAFRPLFELIELT